MAPEVIAISRGTRAAESEAWAARDAASLGRLATAYEEHAAAEQPASEGEPQ
jgi:hypothetical protein